MYPTDRRYSKDHEWIAVDGNQAVVGITEFAQQELGDIVYVELPEEGQEVKAGDVLGTIESVKAVSSLYSPVTGEVIEVNADLGDNLEWLSEEPFGKAWMIKVKVTDTSGDLMDGAAYDAHCQAEG